MTIDQMFDELEDAPYEDYLVRLKHKYEHEKEYTYDNVVLEADGQGGWDWSWDWNEGQTDVEVLGYVAVGDIPVCRVAKWLRGEK